MRRWTLALVGSAASLVVAGSCVVLDDDEPSSRLQSSCVHDNIDLPRDLVDGEECANFSYGDCPAGDMGSECLHYCAFDVCQEAPCEDDDSCERSFGSGWECRVYLVSGNGYGTWCQVAGCPKGTVGCPCDDGRCYAPDSYWEVFCDDYGVCGGRDACPSGCRAGSVCCGGSLCGGDCVGSPCCG